jgi:hypothetical protein
LNANELFIIGDGTKWIETLQNNYFPETIGVLDIWKSERELKGVLGEAKSFVIESLKGLALGWKGSKMLQRLMKVAEERKKIVEVMTYVRNNLD